MALAAGLLLGIVGHASGNPAFEGFARGAKAIGELWVAALQLIVLPLVITHVLAAIVGASAKSVGKLGLRAFLLFLVMLIAAGLFTLLLAPPLIARFPIDPETVVSFKAATPPPQAIGEAGASGSITDWIGGLLPRNILDAALHGDIFSLLLFTVFFAIAVTRLPEDRRRPLMLAFQGLAEALLQMTHWVLLVTPVGVFALVYVLALRSGGSTAQMLVVYVVVASTLMVLFTALLYPLTAVAGRTTLRAFARSAAPAQLVALSTRSSIAALPALVEGGREHLRLPKIATSFVLPFSVSLFKVNRPMSSLVKLLFLAHVYGIPLRPTSLAIFLITVIILSFGTAGVPQSGPGLRTLPAYLAAGVPLEGVLVVEAVETIPDIFKTLLNVTGDMSAAALLSRGDRLSAADVSTSEDPQPSESIA